MIGRVNEIGLKAKQRRALQAIVSRPSEAAGLVRRARVVLLSDDGVPAGEIAIRLDLTAEAVSRIRRRFLHSGVKGLSDRPKAGRKDHALSAETVDKLVRLAMSPPPAGRARWTTRLLARQFGIRRQGERHRGAVLEPTRACDRPERGREDLDPSPRTDSAPSAAALGARSAAHA